MVTTSRAYSKIKCKSNLHLLLLFFLTLFLPENSFAHKDYGLYNESTVRTLVLFNILRFTELTEHSGEELNLCGYGKGNSLEHLTILNGKRINKLTLRTLTPAPSAPKSLCHVVILGSLTHAPTADTFQQEASHVVVCDGCKHYKNLASVELITLKNKVSFNVDLDAAKRSKIEISSDLLALANEVRGEK